MTYIDADIAADLKVVMGNVATPVTIVTAVIGDSPRGTTVSAFTSLSMDPPMVLICLDRGSETLAAIQQTHEFGVNILASHQSQAALTFARKTGTAKFDSTQWRLDHRVPRLPDTSGWLACTVATMFDGGDHIVAAGTVNCAEVGQSRPLVYHDRMFGIHTAHTSP